MTMGMEQRKVVDGYVFQFRNKLTDAADDGDSIAWTVGTVTRTDGGVVDIDDAVSTLNLQDYYHGAGEWLAGNPYHSEGQNRHQLPY